MKRTLLTLAVAALALSGCSSSDEDSPAVAESSPRETSSAPAEATESEETTEPADVEQVALADVCPEVEAAVSETMGDGTTVAGVGDYQVLRGQLQALAETADAEAAGALDDLIDSVNGSIDALASSASTAMLDARSSTRDGIGEFATRCAAAGSSALQ